MPITDITATVEQQVLDALSVAQEAVLDGKWQPPVVKRVK